MELSLGVIRQTACGRPRNILTCGRTGNDATLGVEETGRGPGHLYFGHRIFLRTRRNIRLPGEYLCRVRRREYEMDMGPIECLDSRNLQKHRIGINLVDNLVTGRGITEGRGEHSHLLEPLDVRLVGTVKLFNKTRRDRITHYVLCTSRL